MVRVGKKRLTIGRLRCRSRQPRRHQNVLYQDSARVPVDVVVFHYGDFKEPWFIFVPAGSRDLLHEARHLGGKSHNGNFPAGSAFGSGGGADSSWVYEGAWMYETL
jgi:hypothetical protein